MYFFSLSRVKRRIATKKKDRAETVFFFAEIRNESGFLNLAGTDALNTDFAISATGYAGPGGGTKEIPVGTIWLACGTQEKQVAMVVQEDHGRDINLAIATNKAIQMFLDFLKSDPQSEMEIEKEG